MKTGKYRTADGKAQIEWELRNTENGPEFSASGEYGGSSGQCIDAIFSAYQDDETVRSIWRVWREWHLNGMNAGTPEQAKALNERLAAEPDDVKNPPYNGDHYKWACGYLKSIGLYEVQIEHEPGNLKQGKTIKATGGFDMVFHPVTGNLIYTYGSRWLYRPIPADVLAEIESWPSKPLKSLHVDKATDFLTRNGIKFRATLSNSRWAPWTTGADDDRNHFRVTLSKSAKDDGEHRTEQPRRIVFDFWDSAANYKAGKKTVAAYDVLACIYGDASYADHTFEDYCSDFGESTDSIKAKQTYTRLSRFAKRLRAFFTESELEQLAEIQ